MKAGINSIYQSENRNMIDIIQDITESHILHLSKNDFDKCKIEEIYTCLKLMLNGNYEKYKFTQKVFDNIIKDGLCDKEVQEVLAKVNEKESIRKTSGVYYTPKDVVNFIVENCFNKRVNENDTVISKLDITSNDFKSVIYSDSVFDPTCGAGEFLIGALEKKIELAKLANKTITDKILISIIKTVFGNDINIESVEITKIRLFFELIKYSNNIKSYREFARIINNNMTSMDFVNAEITSFQRFDIIIGNPPYVEDRKSNILPNIKYGNIYANILHNSIEMLTDSGTMGFIIPISYVSTPRMKKIRSHVESHSTQQIILNYADRPDCLFTSVHQKLSIMFSTRGDGDCILYTSGYKYWYKEERKSLFNNIEINNNIFTFEGFYPKIGNSVEQSIFAKIHTINNDNILSMDQKSKENLYLNMRACFWIKAFSFNPGSKEYKGFTFDERMKDFILCLLNSSLFFLYWNIVSDCWHITSKELKHFKVSDNIKDTEEFSTLALQLEKKLEKTKKYIGTKQTEYEYKHKLCKDIIDEIDESLAKIYDLTVEELSYIKSYASKYRESLGGKS